MGGLISTVNHAMHKEGSGENGTGGNDEDKKTKSRPAPIKNDDWQGLYDFINDLADGRFLVAFDKWAHFTSGSGPGGVGGMGGLGSIVGRGGIQFMKYQSKFVLNSTWKNWANYMSNRGWSFGDIQKTLLNGKWSPHSGNNYLNPGNSMSKVTNINTGRSLIIDNVTKDIIHLGKPGFVY